MGKAGRVWYLVALGVALVAIALLVNVLGPGGRPLDLAIRAAAIVGYGGVFLAALSSIYIREATRYFGAPFVRLHHYVAVTSLILLTLHPLGVALDSGTLAVFVPDFTSWFGFWLFGGRQAWYLLGIAALAALATVRKRIPASWRTLHMLMYIAFGFATVHAWLLGTNFQGPVGRAVLIVLAVIMVGAFIQKRRQAARLARRRGGRSG